MGNKNKSQERERKGRKYKSDNLKRARAASRAALLGRDVQVVEPPAHMEEPVLDPAPALVQGEVIDVPELYSSPVIPLIRKTPSHVPATKAKKVKAPSVFPQVPPQSPPQLPPQSPPRPSCSHTAPR